MRGDKAVANFHAVVSVLNWTEADATQFLSAVCESHPDLFGHVREFDAPFIFKPTGIAPKGVKSIRFMWTRELIAPVPRKQLEEDFASRPHSVLSLLREHA